MIDTSKSSQGLVDFHCHLDLYPNHTSLISECERLGIKTLTVTNAPKVWLRNHELVKDCKHVRAALGLHPQLAHQREKELVLFEKYISQTRYIGEVGLDGSQEFLHTMEVQQRVFRKILELCKQSGNKILTVHSRRATSEILRIIQEENFSNDGKVVLHWFTGSLSEAKKALDLGMYFSVNYRMINSVSGKKLIKFLPVDRILTESDGPFINYKNSPTTPKDVFYTLQQTAIELRLAEEMMKQQIKDNLKLLLSSQI